MAVLTEEREPIKRLSVKSFSQIFKYALRHWPYFVFVILAMVVTSFYDASFTPMMNKSLVKALEGMTIAGNDLASFNINVEMIFGINFDLRFYEFMGLFLFSMLVRCVSIFFTLYLADLLSVQIMDDLRRESFEKVQQLSFSYFDKTPTGWILARMQNDTSSVSDLLAWGLVRFFWTIFEIFFLLVTMFSTSWELTLLILTLSPVIMIATPIFQHFLLKFHRIARNAYSNYVRWLSECINGTSTIKTLGIEDNVYHEASEVVDDIRKKLKRAMVLRSFFGPFVNLVSSLSIGLVILICYPNINNPGAWLVVDSSLFVLFVSSVSEVYTQISDFSEIYNEFVANQANAEKIMALINEVPELEDRPDVIEKYGTLLSPKLEAYEPIEGDIEFKNVSFSYLPEIEVIHNLNLHIKKGTSLAIVGETGSGKTTTANLLCRFYEPSEGEVLIDGVNYKDRSVGWLRNSISYVQQNPFIFTGTFRQNIAYGKINATDEEIKMAAHIVGIDKFIEEQKDGYDTVLSDGGNQLSLGQKQLISFARSIVRNPRILILDEATSSIDTESEAYVRGAIDKILDGRTSIIIAHRLSTIVNCDRIIMMENGVIIEDGTHRELMAKKGRYFTLYMSQFQDLKIDTQIETYEREQKLAK